MGFLLCKMKKKKLKTISPKECGGDLYNGMLNKTAFKKIIKYNFQELKERKKNKNK